MSTFFFWFINKKILRQNNFFILRNIKKEILVQAFSYEFCEIFKNTIFTEYLRPTASVDHGLPKLFLNRKE